MRTKVIDRYKFSWADEVYEKPDKKKDTLKHRQQCYEEAMKRIRDRMGIKEDTPVDESI